MKIEAAAGKMSVANNPTTNANVADADGGSSASPRNH